jgi:phosphoenolpyruvate carboxylase
MYQKFPFFRTLVSNLEMVLTKTDLGIASRYAELARDPALRTSIFDRIQSEWQRTYQMVLTITVQDELLEKNPVLARSIRNRLPYIDPLNHLQIELLKRYRSGDSEDRTQQAIHLTINGIAAGLRNSG